MPRHGIANASERAWVQFIAMASQFSAVSLLDHPPPSISHPRSLARRFFMQRRFLAEAFLLGLLYIYPRIDR